MMFLPVNGAGGFVFTLYDYICTVLTVIPNSFGQMLFSTNRVTVMQDVCFLVRAVASKMAVSLLL